LSPSLIKPRIPWRWYVALSPGFGFMAAAPLYNKTIRTPAAQAVDFIDVSGLHPAFLRRQCPETMYLRPRRSGFAPRHIPAKFTQAVDIQHVF